MIGGINNYSKNILSAMQQKTAQKLIDKKFSKLDTNEDGSLSKDELQVRMDEIAEKTGIIPDTNAMFESLDANEDGLLSKEEMEGKLPDGTSASSLLLDVDSGTGESTANLDGNGDGVVEKSEIKAALMQMRLNAYSILYGGSDSDSNSLVNLLK